MAACPCLAPFATRACGYRGGEPYNMTSGMTTLPGGGVGLGVAVWVGSA